MPISAGEGSQNVFRHGFIVWGFFAVYGAVWLAYIAWMRRRHVNQPSQPVRSR